MILGFGLCVIFSWYLIQFLRDYIQWRCLSGSTRGTSVLWKNLLGFASLIQQWWFSFGKKGPHCQRSINFFGNLIPSENLWVRTYWPNCPPICLNDTTTRTFHLRFSCLCSSSFLFTRLTIFLRPPSSCWPLLCCCFLDFYLTLVSKNDRWDDNQVAMFFYLILLLSVVVLFRWSDLVLTIFLWLLTSFWLLSFCCIRDFCLTFVSKTARRVYNRVLIFFCLMILFFVVIVILSRRYTLILWLRFDFVRDSPESPHLISYFWLWHSAYSRILIIAQFRLHSFWYQKESVVVALSLSRLKFLGIRKRALWRLTTND